MLIGEYDFRLNEIGTRDTEILKATNDDDKGALQVYIWRAVRSNSDFQACFPEFANTHMAGIIGELEQAGFTEHAKEAIQAARDLANGNGEVAHQSPHGYGVFTQDFLGSRIKDLRSYSDYIHRKIGSWLEAGRFAALITSAAQESSCRRLPTPWSCTRAAAPSPHRGASRRIQCAIKRDVLGHRPVCVEADGAVPCRRRRALRELEQVSSNSRALPRRPPNEAR
jgi:hypothetical protein